MGLSREDYPDFGRLGELAEVLSKGHLAALVVDLFHQLYGEDLPDNQLRAIVADRTDTLFDNNLVPNKLPKRFPRHRP